MVVKFIRTRGYITGDMGVWNTKSLSLLPDPLGSTLVVLIMNSFIALIDLFKTYSYSIGTCTKNSLSINTYSKYENKKFK